MDSSPTPAPAAPPAAPTTWPEVDGLLGELRRLDVRITAEEAPFEAKIRTAEGKRDAALAKANEAIGLLREERDQKVAALVAQGRLVRDRVLAFVAKTGFAGKARSMKLTNGTVGLRLSTPAVMYDLGEPHAIQALLKMRKDACVVTKLSISAAEVRKLPPDELRKIGARITQSETAYLDLAAAA